MNDKEILNNTYAILKDTQVTRLIMLEKEDKEFIENFIFDKEVGENGYLACKDYGQAYPGGDFWQGIFRPPKAHPALIWNNSLNRWEPDVPRPQETEETIYWFNLENWEWVAIPRVPPVPMNNV